MHSEGRPVQPGSLAGSLRNALVSHSKTVTIPKQKKPKKKDLWLGELARSSFVVDLVVRFEIVLFCPMEQTP